MQASATEVIRSAVLGRLGMLHDMTGLPAVFGGAVEGQADGEPAAVISQLRGLQTASLDGLTVRCGTGLGGRAMGLKKVCVVDDYTGSRLITHEYDKAVQIEGLVAALAAPVRHNGKVVAVLYAASRAMPVGERAMRGAEVVARWVERDLEELLPKARTEPPPVEILAELRAVLDELGDNPIRPRLERVLAALTAAPRPVDDGGIALTTRQIQILRLVGDGLTNREIAQQTGLADATVKTYVHDAMRRLDAHTRTRAVYIARSHGLL